jgi:hypothetical protein
LETVRRIIRTVFVLAPTAATLACAGCYQRTVHAEGPGASRMTVEESYQENWVVDDLIFGQEAKDARAGSRPRR